MPIGVLCVALMFFGVSEGRYECQKVCDEQEYHDFRYVPRGRYGINGDNCYCLTEEESDV